MAALKKSKFCNAVIFLPPADVDDSLGGDDDVDGQVVVAHQVQRQVVDDLRLVDRRDDERLLGHDAELHLQAINEQG